jgi:phosphate transport system permease protein
MVSLPLEAYQAVQSPEPAMIARGFGSAATLLILVLGLFAIARTIGGRGPGQLTARQRRRRLRASRRDLGRFTARRNQQGEPAS